jgi:hypothetical protein
MKRHPWILSACFVVLLSCAPQTQQRGETQGTASGRGFGLAARGIVNLILSPLQIAAGMLEGIAAVPYLISQSVQTINKGMIDANAKVTLDDTYESAYGKRISAVSDTGETGEVFRRMKHATEYFQKVLNRYGVKNPGRYILTSIDTANSMGYTLFAVVYRPYDSITVTDKYDGKTVRTLTKEDRLFYEPFEQDAQGRLMDTVIDWTGMARDVIETQKAQAVLLKIAANAVVNGKKSPEYWDAEKQWIAGEFRPIVEQKMNDVRNKMKL